MLRRSNPEGVHPPLGSYSHTVTVPPGVELVFVSGQVGIRRDGSAPATVAEQADQAFANLVELLAAHGSTVADIAKLTVFIVSGQDGDRVRDARNAYLGAHHPASTTVYVPALVDSRWLLEIEAIAAVSRSGAASIR